MATNTIYIIANSINDKVYIGQTWQSIEDRFYKHGHCHPHRSKIRNAIMKYGHDKFSIQSLVTCDNQNAADYSNKGAK
jgi:hypothetical protein